MAENWLQSFKPDADDLLDLLLPQIDDSMLRQVAAADYGDAVERHLAPLKLFRDERIIPVLDWHPGEVLELVRWSDPDEHGWRPGDEGRRGHLLRAFACSTLLRARERQENNDTYDSFGDTTIQLERSIGALGAAFFRPGASFFAWCVERLSGLEQAGDEKPFFGLALLSLAIRLPDSPDDALVGLCQWIDDNVRSLLHEEAEWLPSYIRGLKAKSWVKLGNELRSWAEAQPASEKTTWVALIGRSLAED